MNLSLLRAGLVFSTCFLALAACKKQEPVETTSQPAEVATAPTDQAAASNQENANLLKDADVSETVDASWQMKPGKWSTQGFATANGQKMDIPEMTFCNTTGQAFSQNSITAPGQANIDCKTSESHPDNNTLAINADCNGSKSDIVITRIDNDHYKQVIKSNVNGIETETELDMKYLGECDANTPANK